MSYCLLQDITRIIDAKGPLGASWTDGQSRTGKAATNRGKEEFSLHDADVSNVYHVPDHPFAVYCVF